MQPLSVLFAPAHVLVDDSKEGSEYHQPYKLMERLALDYGVRITALAVRSNIMRQLPGVRFVSVDPGGPLPVSNLERLGFHVRVYAKARRILASEPPIDVIHHMYPFGFRATFNMLALFRRHIAPRVVIGPLQTPLSFTGSDEASVAVRDFSAPGQSQLKPRRVVPPPSTFVTFPVLSALSRQTLRRADALVACSERTARLYGASSSIDPQRITVIPFGIDTDIFSPRRDDHVAGEREARPVQILAVGYLVQRKAFDVLIKAFANLIAMHLPVHLRLVGDGPARSYLDSLVHHLGISQYVTFVGLVPHGAVVREYHNADIFCSTSLSESFSVVGLEAMSCGLPIVATATGFYRDALREHDVGTLVRFGAVDDLVKALVLMITNVRWRNELSHNARVLALHEYDWRIVAQRYMSLYGTIMRR